MKRNKAPLSGIVNVFNGRVAWKPNTSIQVKDLRNSNVLLENLAFEGHACS